MYNLVFRKTLASVLPLALITILSGCAGVATNPSLDSIHQPVVTRTNYSLDITAGPDGISLPEQDRLAGWFEALNLRYGDRITLDDPLHSNGAREAIESIAGRYGLLVGGEAPVTPGAIAPGTVRIVVTRSSAKVPGCPDWSTTSDANPGNATSSNYGCATNANMAAMIADPEHLLKGANGQGTTAVMSSTKAIDSYRQTPPTGEQGLSKTSTQTAGK